MDDARIKLVEANPNNQPAGKPEIPCLRDFNAHFFAHRISIIPFVFSR